MGDVLIHCGDFTEDLGQASLRSFLRWFNDQPHAHKIFVAGNHDGALEKWPDLARAMIKEFAPTCTYLQDEGCVIGTTNFWGSPVSPRFFDWHFNRDRGADIRRHWDMIPDNTDVLITHGPPFGILDINGFDKTRVGCRDLYEAFNRIQPAVHCFGHIHHSYGTHKFVHDMGNSTMCLNASCCNERYKPVNQPWVYQLPL